MEVVQTKASADQETFERGVARTHGEFSGRIARALLVVNPASRRGEAALADVLASMAEAEVACETRITTAPGDASRIVRAALDEGAHGFDAVFTLGGDGTAMEAATALAEYPDAPPLGVIAVGTANVLARTLGIPLGPREAARELLGGCSVRMDLGQVTGGASFAIGLGVGLDASMIAGASTAMKRRIGYLAYAWSAIRAGLARETFTARIVVDGVAHDVRTSSVLVANCGTVLGGRLCFGECVENADGMLDACIYSPRTLLDSVRIFWKMLAGGVAADRCVRILPGRHITIETDPPRQMQSDGELLGLTPVEIRVAPAAVRVLIPRTRTFAREQIP